MEYLHYSTFSTSVTGIVLLKIQMYEKKTIMSSSFKKAVAKNSDGYEVICFTDVLLYAFLVSQ